MKKLFIIGLLMFILGGCSANKKAEQGISAPQNIASTSTAQEQQTIATTADAAAVDLGGRFSYTNEVSDNQGNIYFVLKNIAEGDPACLYPDVLKDKEIPEKCKHVLAECHDRRQTDSNGVMVTGCELYKKSKDGEITKIKTVYNAGENNLEPGFNPDKNSLHNFTMLEYKDGKMLILYGTDYSGESYMNIAWFDLKNFSVEDIYHDYKLGDYGYVSFQNRQDELIIISDNKSSHFSEAPEYVQKLANGVYYKKNGQIKKIETSYTKFIYPSYYDYINKFADVPEEEKILFKTLSESDNTCIDLYSFDVKTEKLSQTNCVERLTDGAGWPKPR